VADLIELQYLHQPNDVDLPPRSRVRHCRLHHVREVVVSLFYCELLLTVPATDDSGIVAR
jgi:hypothetical protein